MIRLLAAGSSCQASPIIYVTAHMPDDQVGGGSSGLSYVALQMSRYIARTSAAVNELKQSDPSIRVRFVDLYTPFLQNRGTTAFPNEVWSTGGVPDWVKIGRTVDLMHIRRLASIYCGEIIADSFDLTELRAIAPNP
jgi:hypothetical protein